MNSIPKGSLPLSPGSLPPERRSVELGNGLILTPINSIEERAVSLLKTLRFNRDNGNAGKRGEVDYVAKLQKCTPDLNEAIIQKARSVGANSLYIHVREPHLSYADNVWIDSKQLQLLTSL